MAPSCCRPAAHPKDKPKVEVSVQIAQRWILAVLRHQTFFTLADLNTAIRTCLDAVNARPMQVVGVSRRALFEQLDQPALRPLPRHRYELATWKPCRVNIDYHVEVDHHWYSVPYQLVHARVEARVTATTIEVFLRGRRVASHARLTGRGRYSTDVAHMPLYFDVNPILSLKGVTGPIGGTALEWNFSTWDKQG